MGNTEEFLILDFCDCINFIMNKTGLAVDIISKVLDAENEYMMRHGILQIDDGK